jgi:hypothetical protein
MSALNIHVGVIEVIMPLIEAFRWNIVASALQARDMTLGPHRYVVNDLCGAIEAIDDLIQGVSPLLVGNWVTAYVKSVRGQS